MSFGEPVTFITRGAPIEGSADEQGNPLSGPDVEVTTDGWAVEPVMGTESAEPYGQEVVLGYRLFKRDVIETYPLDARARVRGAVWALSGQVGDWENPYSKWRGTVLNVKAV